MVLIYAEHLSSRLTYVFDFVFNRYLGVGYRSVYDSSADVNYSSNSSIEATVQVFPAGLLSSISNRYSKAEYEKNMTLLSENDDVFTRIFLFLTRYEEFVSDEKDEYGRFLAKYSSVFTEEIAMPYVNMLINQLASELNIPISTHTKNITATVDVDIPFLHKGHSPLKKLYYKYRWGGGNQSDLFDQYSYMSELFKGLNPVFFFLHSDSSVYDPNRSLNTDSYDSLLGAFKDEVGVHPSYDSVENHDLIGKQKKELERLSGKRISKSRQHYLRIENDSLVAALEEAGISHDYSSCFADKTGWRSGTTLTYPWYDIKQEKELKIMIVPTVFMDATLKSYLQLSPDEAIQKIDELLEVYETFGGEFCFLWHNTSLSQIGDWNPWRKVLEHIVNKLNK